MEQNWAERLTERMHAIQDREEHELQELLKDPEKYKLCQLLTDRLIKGLDYLFNFECVVSHAGDEVKILDAHDVIRQHILDEFKRITGKEYQFRIVRQSRFRNARKKQG